MSPTYLLLPAGVRFPNFVKIGIIKKISEELGPAYDVATHFTPRYNPWQQRLCLLSDGDLFQPIKHGRASVVTAQIEPFTETGIRLQSGEELQADIVVTATGLVPQAFGRAKPGHDIRINASWTLKADLICTHVCRLLNLMDKEGARQVTPRSGHEAAAAPFVEKFNPGYMERAIANWPKQSSKAPWRVYQNYIRDIWSLKWSPVDNKALELSSPVEAPSQRAL